MRIKKLHPWNISTKDAASIQTELQTKVSLKKSFKTIKLIAGCDAAIDIASNQMFGGVIVYSYPDLKEIERQNASEKISFPYVPGFLSFREAPLLLKVIERLKTNPDLFIFDGQGIAHPRMLGIASHLGLFLDRPAIGCAKSRLIGDYKEPGTKRGSYTTLFNKQHKQIGIVLRTRDNVKPLFISPGHKIDFENSKKVILNCFDGYRVPKPTREADIYVEKVKRDYLKKGK